MAANYFEDKPPSKMNKATSFGVDLDLPATEAQQRIDPQLQRMAFPAIVRAADSPTEALQFMEMLGIEESVLRGMDREDGETTAMP